MTAKCIFWILIRNAQFEIKFERQYFGPCVCQITSRCIIWNAHFKWWSRGVFQLCISQITQRNQGMNALTSKSWFWGAEQSDLLTTSAYIPRAAYVQKHRKCELHACLIGRVPRHSSPAGMQNPKFGLSCVHCVIQISQLLLSCVHCIIQNAHFELKFKIRTLPSCENSLGHLPTRTTHHHDHYKLVQPLIRTNTYTVGNCPGEDLSRYRFLSMQCYPTLAKGSKSQQWHFL